MKNGNLIGVVASVLLVVGAALEVFSPSVNLFDGISVVLTWVAVLLLIYAGIRGSPWWFLLPVGLIAVWRWALSQGH